MEGLERFCGQQVYIGINVDSYDLDPLAETKGQILETSETNNVDFISSARGLAGLDCGHNRDVEHKCRNPHVYSLTLKLFINV